MTEEQIMQIAKEATDAHFLCMNPDEMRGGPVADNGEYEQKYQRYFCCALRSTIEFVRKNEQQRPIEGNQGPIL